MLPTDVCGHDPVCGVTREGPVQCQVRLAETAKCCPLNDLSGVSGAGVNLRHDHKARIAPEQVDRK